MSDTNATAKKTDKPIKPAVKAAKSTEPKLTGKEKAAIRRADVAKIFAFAKEYAEKAQNTEIAQLIAKYSPHVREEKGPRFAGPVLKIFGDQSTRHEDEVYKEHKVGRFEMKKMMELAVTREKPEHRVWALFDIVSGNYRLYGIGPNKPADWPASAPLPKEKKD